MEFTFEVNLIRVSDSVLPEQVKELESNCTHVIGDYWIYEGDEAFLDAPFVVLKRGIVGPLGDLSEDKLRNIVEESFGIKIGRDGLMIMPECEVCGKRKAPRGRSVPTVMAQSYCHWSECDGYEVEPTASSYFEVDEPSLTGN